MRKSKPKTRCESMAIVTPNPSFSGERCGVQFSGGKGFTTNPQTALDCLGLGYLVQDAAGDPVNSDELVALARSQAKGL